MQKTLHGHAGFQRPPTRYQGIATHPGYAPGVYTDHTNEIFAYRLVFGCVLVDFKLALFGEIWVVFFQKLTVHKIELLTFTKNLLATSP